ncbi:MAG: response regulator [Candidatus Omnitrophica bacterium]|nr:response regulator [Candidatus Omnitrophota bacterium]MBU1933197.1 response regulator [Candidatus Omnitrophota bacterium]
MTGAKRKVLLAEREKSIAEIIVYLLNAWDYEVISVADGLSVLETVRREHPDIILIDSNLPKIDGLKVSKALKEDFLTAHIPVIILIDKKQIRKKMLEIEQGVDDYIANPPDPIDLEVRIEMALRRTMHQLHANALTRLPGNLEIEKIVQSKIEKRLPFSVAYYDIDNFKSFNDKYGYMKGDSIICHTAYVISTTVKRCGNKDDFVGHIGGDDFVVVTTPERDRLIASESILSFNRLAPFHYSKEDRERGYIAAKDRKGNIANAPLMSISIAIANNKDHTLENAVQLMEIIAEIKAYLKTLPGSNFLVNRRGPEEKEFIQATPEVSVGKPVRDDVTRFKYRPIGQILLESNVISIQQLEIALSKHWTTGQKIGQSIIDLGMASPGDIARALELQLNVPHFDVRNFDRNGELEGFINRIPVDLMRQSQAIPVNKDKNVLSLAMMNPKDIAAIDKIRSVTGCNVAPFFVLENEFEDIWERVIKKADKGH